MVEVFGLSGMAGMTGIVRMTGIVGMTGMAGMTGMVGMMGGAGVGLWCPLTRSYMKSLIQFIQHLQSDVTIYTLLEFTWSSPGFL